MTVRDAAAWLVLLAAGSGSGGPAEAQCVYTPLSGAVTQAVSTTPGYFSFNQTSSFWSVVGIRSAAGSNWNLDLFQSTDAFPNCVSGLKGTSNGTSGVDLVITDFNPGRTPLGLYYPRATRASGSGNAVVEWDDGSDALTINAPLINRTTDDSDVLRVWDVFLNAGVDYSFQISASGADVKLLLFKNLTGSAYSAGRNAAEFETTTPLTYTPSSSGFYGVVVLNDNGAVGSYSLGVRACVSPKSLSPGVAATTELAESFFSFHQMSSYWTAIAVRGSSNWQLVVDQRLGPGFPSCLDSLLSSSLLSAPAVDVVAGNFSNEFLGTYYAHVYLDQSQGSGTATVEWDDGANELIVDGAPVNRATDSNDVLEAWDVYLEAGQTYSFLLSPAGANLKLLLFNDTGTAWFGRASAEFEATGNHAYQAPVDGFYGAVIVNDNGATGSYSLQVRTGSVAVEGELTYRTELISVTPNPARSGARFAFSLAEPASVSFDVLDVAGRIVGRIPVTRQGAGRWNADWKTVGEDGSPVRAGLYFLRMTVAGRQVGIHKFTIIR